MIGKNVSWLRLRILIIYVLFCVLFLVVLARAYHLQIIRHDEIVAVVERYQQEIVELEPLRGMIEDRTGRLLALSIELDSVYIHPHKIERPKDIVVALSRIAGQSSKSLEHALRKPRSFVWIKRGISPSQSTLFNSLELEGAGLIQESQRFYPNGSLAGHVLGFAGIDDQGLEGIEKKYDPFLRGRPRELHIEKDALGGCVNLKPIGSWAEEGATSVRLTIDAQLQFAAERELELGLRECKAVRGSVVAMDPRTGAVLAMAVAPRFDPNRYSKSRPDYWRNRSVMDAFEPGSTMKSFLFSAAIEEELDGELQHIFCENGSYPVDDAIIHDIHPHGLLAFDEVLKVSSNIGASKIGEELGPERLHRYLTTFGFGARTGIDLPGEAQGILRPWKEWKSVDLANISFGQGVSASTIQLATAMSAIANGGHLMQPFLVESVHTEEGDILYSGSPRCLRRVISRETAHRMTGLLYSVTEPGGTGEQAALPGYSVAGKTGTAQKYDPRTGTYAPGRYVASFIGFLPATDPALVLVTMIDEPSTSSYGGVVAAPVFRRIALKAARILGIRPDVPTVTQIVQEMKTPRERT